MQKSKHEKLTAALAVLAAADPTGRFLDILAGQRLAKPKKTEEEMTDEDRARIAAAEAKRARKAAKRC